MPGADGDVPVIAVPSASARGLYAADVAAYNHYRVDREQGAWRLTIEERRLADGGECFEVAGEQVLMLPRP